MLTRQRPQLAPEARSQAGLAVAPESPSPTSTPSARASRRAFLRVAGGGVALVAVGSVGAGAWRAVDQGVFSTGTGPAYAAWTEWTGTTGGGPLNLVRAAILAANAHNSQPWFFRVAPSQIDIYVDRSRHLGALDALRREQELSLGCAAENLLLAARAHGYSPTLTLFPDAAVPALVARVELAAGPLELGPLYQAIPKRHTNRAAYSTTRPVTAQGLASMTALADSPDVGLTWYTSPDEKRAFGDLTIRATEAINADSEQSTDSFRWWRGNWDLLQSRKDGITLDAAGLSPLVRTAAKLLPDISRHTNDATWLDTTRHQQVATAAAFGVVLVRDHQDTVQRFEAGRLYQRLHLFATSQGLAMQPLNQVVERRDREQSAGLPLEFTTALAAITPDGFQMVMPFRIGYPTAMALKSPRRPAHEVIQA